ncbi:MAG: MobC family plasmid mobilization relaxosome protein [Acidobacteriota bacterium]|nr:MobC family plasmid mobilization relaxosome protein [Acidobacteriota bacterium]
MSKSTPPTSNGNQPKKEKPKITVRPTDGELKLLHARAASFGYKSLSKYLIERGLRDGAMIQTPERERVERLLFEVRKIGVNINQIAHGMNAGNVGYPKAQLERAMHAVERVMKDIVREFKG